MITMKLRNVLPLCLLLTATAACPGEETEIPTVGPCQDPASITGDAFITSDEALSELEGVVAITGDLQIRDRVTDLSALQSLRCVGGSVIVRNANALTSLDGLGALTFVGDSLSVVDNAELATTRGIGAALVVEGAVRIANNPALESLAGLDALVSVGDELRISENPQISALPQMESLSSKALEGIGPLGAMDKRTAGTCVFLIFFLPVETVLDVRSNQCLLSIVPAWT